MAWGRGRYFKGRYVSRRSEVTDLIISWLVLSIAFGAGYIFRGDLTGFTMSLIAVATGFVFHELAHRYVAVKHGMVARYKAWYLGLVTALIVALLTAKIFGNPFVIAAPGAVVIMHYGMYDLSYLRYEYRIAAAGPLANIAVALATLVASYLISLPWSYYVRFIGSVNAWLAFFNLIPLPPLDGSKVFRASISTWLVMFILAIALFIIM